MVASDVRAGAAHQSPHGAVQGISVVSAELGVGTLQGGVTVGLGLLNTVCGQSISMTCS